MLSVNELASRILSWRKGWSLLCELRTVIFLIVNDNHENLKQNFKCDKELDNFECNNLSVRQKKLSG